MKAKKQSQYESGVFASVLFRDDRSLCGKLRDRVKIAWYSMVSAAGVRWRHFRGVTRLTFTACRCLKCGAENVYHRLGCRCWPQSINDLDAAEGAEYQMEYGYFAEKGGFLSIETIRDMVLAGKRVEFPDGERVTLNHLARMDEDTDQVHRALQEAEEKVSVAESIGMVFGYARTSGGDFWSYILREGSELQRLHDEMADAIALRIEVERLTKEVDRYRGQARLMAELLEASATPYDQAAVIARELAGVDRG